LGRFLNPVRDIRLLWALYGVYRRGDFALVHTHTIKPNIYGTLAAKMAGVKTIVGSVRGRGSVFTETVGLKRALLRRMVMALYRFAFRFTDRVQFLNGDDLEFFVTSGMIAREKAVLIKSSGVNLDDYHANAVSQEHKQSLRQEFGVPEDVSIVMMVARAYWSKGVEEFLAAASAISTRHRVMFLLAGSVEEGPDAVPRSYLEAHQSDCFRWVGYRKDVRDVWSLADVAVLPSYYPEGIPRSMLEAMAMSKPIVTTDSIGCRDVVEDGKNGFLIPIKDANALTNAIDRLLQDESLRASYGAYSRQKVEREFGEQEVAERVIDELYQLPSLR
jgi:N,N'-diacetylbacillosaminyl-diphospho-undecaprenol alpha-1,3-N-acetylgalactosaminyltransferase